MCVYIYVCVCLNIRLCAYMHTHTHSARGAFPKRCTSGVCTSTSWATCICISSHRTACASACSDDDSSACSWSVEYRIVFDVVEQA